MNEGSCDPQGRFHCGSMAYDQAEGAATLWRLDPDGSVHAVLTGVTVSNGLCWEPGGAFAYYDDMPTQTVAKLHFADDGSVAAREPWVEDRLAARLAPLCLDRVSRCVVRWPHGYRKRFR